MKKKISKNFLISFIFYFHLIIVLLWFGLFFIPVSFWPRKIEVHFWYMTIILASQLLWGVILYPKTQKITFVCPFTTLMQSLRGYPINNKKNYYHSFIAELSSRLKIKLGFFTVNILLIVTYGIASIRFIISVI